MSVRILWVPEALEDVERIHILKQKSPEAARRAAQTILDGARTLELAPEAGRPMGDDTGRRELFLAFGAGAYVLRYRRDPSGNVVVIRVWHAKEHRDGR